MVSKDIEEMRKYRKKMNDIILSTDDKNIKRFFAHPQNKRTKTFLKMVL